MLSRCRFYGGNLVYRGHFNASGEETAVQLAVQYGFAGGYTAWLNGVFLGSGQGNATVSLSENVWPIPNDTLRVGTDNVLLVVQGMQVSSLWELFDTYLMTRSHWVSGVGEQSNPI